MTPSLLFALPDNVPMTCSLATRLQIAVGALVTRQFPDGETYLRFETDVAGKDIAFVCALAYPNAKLISLLLAAEGARQLGATRVGLIAPYLAYMRQDARFQAGETVTSQIVGELLSEHFDWLVTVDPHLHRHRTLSEIYSIPATVVHAAPAISAWIADNIERPFLIGPDAESAQWVAKVAENIKAPYTTFKKRRNGDSAVTFEQLDISLIGSRTPVLVDDIIASGETVMEAARLLHSAGIETPPICVAVHGIFADQADRSLADLGVRVVTTNTILNSNTGIFVDDAIADGIFALREKIRSSSDVQD